MDEKTLSLESRVLAFVAWALSIVGAIIALLIAANSNKYVKQHAIQSLTFYTICAIVAVSIKVTSILGLLTIPSSLVESILYFTSFIVGLLCAIKAYKGSAFRFPLIYRIAKVLKLL